jgi:D-beta-D-heptose 7-phosphate kinase / D-beta-D-heptose 1-phosphate adenosyltransferase
MNMRTNISDHVQGIVSGGFGGGRILVIGDLMLDRYRRGDVDRISAEAPVPIVSISQEFWSAGGAGNVAVNLASLGLETAVIGVVGSDDEGGRLRSLLVDAGVEVTGVLAVPERPTTFKDRIMAGAQQMMRLDRETREPVTETLADRIVGGVKQAIEDGVTVVVLSDYAKGVLTDEICQTIISMSSQANIPVIVDPVGLDYSKYAGATALSPNRNELAAVANVQLSDIDGLRSAGSRVRDDLRLEYLVITLGGEGMELVRDGGIDHIPALAREVFDVSGAGDTVIATLAAGVSAGLSALDSLTLAAVTASMVVGRVGTVAVSRDELVIKLSNSQHDGSQNGVYHLSGVLERVSSWREDGERIVFTNGCFDLLHVGHISVLESARSNGDRLVVGLNSDNSTHRLKGDGRPLNTQEARARVLAALSIVDAVVIFDEDTPIELVNALRPDVLVKGGDYTEDVVVGGPEVKSWGGRVVISPLEGEHSTTELIRRIGDT